MLSNRDLAFCPKYSCNQFSSAFSPSSFSCTDILNVYPENKIVMKLILVATALRIGATHKLHRGVIMQTECRSSKDYLEYREQLGNNGWGRVGSYKVTYCTAVRSPQYGIMSLPISHYKSTAQRYKDIISTHTHTHTHTE